MKPESKVSSNSAGISKGAGPEVPESTDSSLQENFHNRTYNPVDGAKRGSVSSELNTDSARYKKGPGPL